MSTATFAYNDANLFTPNTVNGGGNGSTGGVTWVSFNEQCGQHRFDFYGEQLEWRGLLLAGDAFSIQIDGGASVPTALTPDSDAVAYYLFASGLSLGWHTVVVRWFSGGSNRFAQTDTFRVTASDDAPAIRKTPGFNSMLRVGATGFFREGKAALGAFFNFANTADWTLGYEHHKFRAKTSSLRMFGACGGDVFVALYVDGALAGDPGLLLNNPNSGGYSDFMDVAAAVGYSPDGSTFHDYEVALVTGGKSVHGYCSGYASSDSFDTTATFSERSRDGYLGDSINRGYLLPTPFNSWTYLASRAAGRIAINVGEDGSQEVNDGATNATALIAYGPFEYLTNEYGTNDAAASGSDTPTSGFGAADLATLNKLLESSGAKVRRLGILPRSGMTDAKRGAWNGSSGYGIQANIAASNNPSRVTYYDPNTVGLVDPGDYTETPPTERLHPDASGNVKIAALFADTSTRTSFLITSKSRGLPFI